MIQRNNSIDALKAFTITLVVIGHVIQYSKIDFDKDILFKYIYSFHMPLFIFISGYVTYKDNDAYKGFVRNKLHSLIIPYFSWLFLSSVISAIKNNSNVFFNIKRILVYPDYGLWFLWVLFFMHIVLYIQVKYFNKYFIAFMSTLSISFLGLSYVFKFDNLLSFKMFSFLFPFYIVGYFCNKQKSYIVGLIKKWYLFSPFFIFLAFFWNRNDAIILFDFYIYSKLDIYFYKYLTAFSAIFLFFGLFMSSIKFPKIILNIGKNSLIIYALNFYYFTIISILISEKFILKYFYLLCIPITFLIILISLYSGELLKKSKILSFFFLGLKTKRNYHS